MFFSPRDSKKRLKHNLFDDFWSLQDWEKSCKGKNKNKNKNKNNSTHNILSCAATCLLSAQRGHARLQPNKGHRQSAKLYHTHTHTDIYIYLYIYIPAKPLSRRRQTCHLSRSNFAPRAGETRFFLFLSAKIAFWSTATSEFEHVHFAWQAQCFLILQKSRIAFSLAGTRLFTFLARSGWFFFVLFLSCLWRCFLSLGGGSGGLGVGGEVAFPL